MRCLLITGVPSPFQIELAEGISNSGSAWEMDVWFYKKLPSHRGAHWLSKTNSDTCYFLHQLNGHESTQLEDLLTKNKYDAVVAGVPIRLKSIDLLYPVLARQIPLVYWNEQPIPRNAILSWLKRISYQHTIYKLGPKAIFAIGDRAVRDYRSIYSGPVFCVPYYQKLTPAPSRLDRSQYKKIRFIFSGRLVARNNITSILTAVKLLIDQGLEQKFEVVFFGNGPLKKAVQSAEDELCGTIQHASYSPQTWEDRLNPIEKADVLICPGHHSGWGLTIPEALYLGKPVISSHGIESARYFIKDGVNGFLCDRSAQDIAFTMRIFIDSPSIIDEMRLSCFESARYGDVVYGSKVFARLLTQICNKVADDKR